MSPPLVSKQLQVVQTCASQSSQYHVVWRFDVPPTSNYMQRTPKQPWFVLSVFVISPVSSLRSISIWYRMIIMSNEVMNPLQHIALHYQNLHYPSLGGSWNIDSCPAMFNFWASGYSGGKDTMSADPSHRPDPWKILQVSIKLRILCSTWEN